MSGNSDGQDLTVHSFHEVSLAALTSYAASSFMSQKWTPVTLFVISGRARKHWSVRGRLQLPLLTQWALPGAGFNLLESLAWQFNFQNDKRDKTDFAQMETEVEIDVGQESFPTRKVGQISSLFVRNLDKTEGRGRGQPSYHGQPNQHGTRCAQPSGLILLPIDWYHLSSHCQQSENKTFWHISSYYSRKQHFRRNVISLWGSFTLKGRSKPLLWDVPLGHIF